MLSSTLSRDFPQQAALRTIVLMRLVALSCLSVIVVISTTLLDIELRLFPLFAVIGALAAFSAWTWWRMHQARAASDLMPFVQLLIDICALSIMLYFCGGATNPFVSFYLPALAVAAALLPWGQSLLLSILAIGAYSLLTNYFEPLHIGNADRAISYHLAGMWANFAFSAALITWFVAVLSRTVRQRDSQLAQARERFLENGRLAALGVQAANTAHEMGSPLSTMAIIVGDLLAEAAQSQTGAEMHTNTQASLHAYREDFATMEMQIALCKAALDRMGKEAAIGESDEPVFAKQWLRQFSSEWRLRYPSVSINLIVPEDDASITGSAPLAQILTTLLDNAAQAIATVGDGDRLSPPSSIQLRLQLDTRNMLFEVIDDGPGISAKLLPLLGQGPITQGNRGHGIGLFLAFATARQIGASIELTPTRPSGTHACLKVPRP